MKSRCSGPGWLLGDTKESGRRVTCKAPLAHLVGGSGRSEASPTAILQGTHNLEGVSLLKNSRAPFSDPYFRGLNLRFWSVLAWVLGCFGLLTAPTPTFSTGWCILRTSSL